MAGYQKAVFTTALRVSSRPSDAEDLAAEAFLRAYAALRGYPPERITELRIRPWLITIVLNLWRNQVRSARRRPVLDALPSGPAGHDVPSTTEGPEEQAERAAGRDGLVSLLAQLSPTERVAVVLRHVVGLPYHEIAEVVGRPEGTVKAQVSRGLGRGQAGVCRARDRVFCPYLLE